MPAHYVIAIDGFAGTGKSTLARDLARKLNFLYLDTGAMYRAVALYMLQHSIDWTDTASVAACLPDIHISFSTKGKQEKVHTLLNGKDVEKEIRGMTVSDKVSEVAAISAVRRFLVTQQRAIAANRNVVLDGRDIGTVVFPNANLKLFVTAPMNVRVERRWKELQKEGLFISREQVRANLEKRDREETERLDSPLRAADNALYLDTGNMDRQQQLAFILHNSDFST